MNRFYGTLPVLAMLCLPAQASDCTCRAKGVVAKEGQVACLSTSKGRRLARCVKVLNNTSWTFTEQSCGDMLSRPSRPDKNEPRQDNSA